MRIRTLVTAATLFGVTGVAGAQGMFSNLLTGPYVGAGVGGSEFDIGDGNWGTGVTADDDNDTAWRIFAGVKPFSFVGFELGYFDLGEATGSGGASAEVRGVDLTALGVVPVLEAGPHQFEVFGKVGGYWWDADVSGVGPGSDLEDGDDFDYTFGVGAQYHWNQFGVRAEWQQYNDVAGAVDTDVWMASAMFRF